MLHNAGRAPAIEWGGDWGVEWQRLLHTAQRTMHHRGIASNSRLRVTQSDQQRRGGMAASFIDTVFDRLYLTIVVAGRTRPDSITSTCCGFVAGLVQTFSVVNLPCCTFVAYSTLSTIAVVASVRCTTDPRQIAVMEFWP